MSVYLSIDKCPKHGYYAISIDIDGVGGSRLTDSKCCGQWQRVKAWKMTPEKLRSIARELQCEAEHLEGKA